MSSPKHKTRKGSNDHPPTPTADSRTDADDSLQQEEKPGKRKSSRDRQDDDAASDEVAQPGLEKKKGKEPAKNTEDPSPKKNSKPNSKGKKDEEASEEGTTKEKGGKKSIKDRFNLWPTKSPHPPGEEELPEVKDHWGWVITSADANGKDFSKQPPAKTSDGQTEPPLWENREGPVVKGDRLRTIDDQEINQEDHLVLRLLDMRRKSKDDPAPKREPMHAAFHGTPKDWDDGVAITKLNQSRKDYIKRVCCDKVWTNMEARFLADQFQKNPNISIMELTCMLNDHFKGKTYIDNPEKWDNVSKGRTIECVRAEYLENRAKYDKGEAPHKDTERDRSEVVEASEHNVTVGQMMDLEEDNKVEVPEDKDGNPTYDKLTIALLRRHARQRDPAVSLAKLRTKAEIVARLEEADKEGVDENGIPNQSNAGSSKPAGKKGAVPSGEKLPETKKRAVSAGKKLPGQQPQGSGTLLWEVVDIVFEIDPDNGASAYDAPIKRLRASRVDLLKKHQRVEAEELSNIIESLRAAQDARIAAQISEAESTPRRRSGSSKRLRADDEESTSSQKRSKSSTASKRGSNSSTRTSSRKSSTPSKRNSNASSGAGSRTSSKVTIDERANEVFEPGAYGGKYPSVPKSATSSRSGRSSRGSTSSSGSKPSRRSSRLSQSSTINEAQQRDGNREEDEVEDEDEDEDDEDNNKEEQNEAESEESEEE